MIIDLLSAWQVRVFNQGKLSQVTKLKSNIEVFPGDILPVFFLYRGGEKNCRNCIKSSFFDGRKCHLEQFFKMGCSVHKNKLGEVEVEKTVDLKPYEMLSLSKSEQEGWIKRGGFENHKEALSFYSEHISPFFLFEPLRIIYFKKNE